jgi:hypothetical protein
VTRASQRLDVPTLLRRGVEGVGWAIAALLTVVLGLLAGFGWLYLLRGLGWLAAGPRVADALPLLQLASFDGQPLLRVLVAWLLAGTLAGVALGRLLPGWRVAVTGILGLVILLVASQAAYALARNLPFGSVVFSRTPGFGPVLEAMAFAAGSVLPDALRHLVRASRRGLSSAAVSGVGDLGLRGGQDGNAGQHDADGDEVGGGRRRAQSQRLAEGDQSADQRHQRGQTVHQ